MQQYGLSFGFREPYQVLGEFPCARWTPKSNLQEELGDQFLGGCILTITLVDADVLKDADRFKMDLIGGLERTLHGQVKPSKQICFLQPHVKLS